jgi:hypothetical protein
MPVSLLLPAGLLALAALLLPLVLHLVRASEGERIDFAALRWLQARVRPRRRLRLREWLLLLLRLLLVAAVALLFARPVLPGDAAPGAVVFVAPGVSVAAARAAAGRQPADARWQWLAPGFPTLDAATPAPAGVIASLLREADARTAPGTRMTVVVPAEVEGADGERPRLARAIAWRVVAPDAPTATTPAARGSTASAPAFAIRHAEPLPAGARVLAAVASAWRRVAAPEDDAPGTIDSAPLDTPLAPDTRWLAWVAPDPLPAPILAWTEAGGVVLIAAPRGAETRAAPSDAASPEASTVAWRRDDGVVLARATPRGRGRIVRLALPLDARALPELLEPAFPRQVRALFAGPPPAPTRVPAAALRPVRGAAGYPLSPRPLDPWLVVLAAFLLLAERTLATWRRRERAT